jgi:hypothetical protein
MAFNFLKGIIARAAGSAVAVDAISSGSGSAVKATNTSTGYAVEAVSGGITSNTSNTVAAIAGSTFGVANAVQGANSTSFASPGTAGVYGSDGGSSGNTADGVYGQTAGSGSSGHFKATGTGKALYAEGPATVTGLITASAGIQLPVGNSPAGTSSGYLQVASDHGLVFNDAGTLRIGRTIEHGTSFPGSPYDTQLYFRDDLFTLYEYDSSTFSGPSGNWYKVGTGGKDNTTRSDSTTNPGRLQTGQAWQPLSSATGGIRSNQLYFPGDTSADTMIFKSYGCDQPVIQVQMAGTNNSATNYRAPVVQFHYIDASNYFGVEFFNGTLALFKVDGGSVTTYANPSTTLTDGTFYTITIAQSGTLITVYKNGVAVISAQDIFATANYKFLAADTCGLEILKAGSPATAVNFKNYVVRQAA